MATPVADPAPLAGDAEGQLRPAQHPRGAQQCDLGGGDEQRPGAAGHDDQPQHVALGGQPRVDPHAAQQHQRRPGVAGGGGQVEGGDVQRVEPDRVDQHGVDDRVEQQRRGVAQAEHQQQHQVQRRRRIPQRHAPSSLELARDRVQRHPRQQIHHDHQQQAPCRCQSGHPAGDVDPSAGG